MYICDNDKIRGVYTSNLYVNAWQDERSKKSGSNTALALNERTMRPRGKKNDVNETRTKAQNLFRYSRNVICSHDALTLANVVKPPELVKSLVASSTSLDIPLPSVPLE